MAVSSENKNKMAFALMVGIIYILFGIIQMIVGLGLESGITDALLIPADIFGGCVLLVIGAIFLYGYKELKAGTNDGVAFIYFGILLSLVFVVIYLLIMGADALCTYGLGMEDLESWTPLDDVKPGLYLGILALMGFLAWKDKFTLRGVSKAGA